MRTRHTSSNDAVDVEEHALAELDVRSVITEERWLHPDRIATCVKELAQNASALVLLCFSRCVQSLAEVACSRPGGNEVRIERVVQLAVEHLLALAGHRSFYTRFSFRLFEC